MARIVTVRVDQAWPQQWPQDVVNIVLPILASRPRVRDIHAFACTCRQFWDWSGPWRTSISLSRSFVQSPESNLRVTVRASQMQDGQKRLLACAAMNKGPKVPDYMQALGLIKDIADRSDTDDDCAEMLAVMPAEEFLAVASVLAFSPSREADERAVNLLKKTFEDLPSGPVCDKLALMFLGLLRTMRPTYGELEQALMRNLERIGPSAQIEVISKACPAGVSRRFALTVLGLIRSRLLDGTLLAHAGADACLSYAYTNVRPLPRSYAPQWLGEEVIACLAPRVGQLDRPREWTADSAWVLPLLSAARRLYRDDKGELTRIFSSVGTALEAGGWRFMTSHEFTTYCDALQSSEMTGQFTWMQQNPASPRDKCVVS